jgi:D-alanyl-D-alanine carboxypeptidase
VPRILAVAVASLVLAAVVAAVAFGWLPWPGRLPAPAADPATHAALQAALDRWREENDLPGAVLGVRGPRSGDLLLASGAIEPSARFRVGSITKSFVSAVVLALADQERLGLDDPLDRYVVGVRDGGAITVRHLLAHRSGIPDYESLPGFHDAVGRDLTRPWSPAEVVQLVEAHPRLFVPGVGYAYSSTNYTLLGMVVERVEGKPLAIVLRERIAEPLGLHDTRLAPDEEIEGLAVGHTRLHAARFGAAAPLDVRNVPRTAIWSIAWAGGGMASSAPDLLAWADRLYGSTDPFLSEAARRAMLDVDPAVGPYGLGAYVQEAPAGREVGHGGSYLGFAADLRHLPEHGITVVALTNGDWALPLALVRRATDVLLGGADAARLDEAARDLRDATLPIERREAAGRDLGTAAMRGELPSDQTAVEDLVGTLAETLAGDPEPRARAAAALALGPFAPRSPVAAAALKAAQSDPSPTVREAAALAASLRG